MIALKLVLTPLLIGMASVAGRRWGPMVSGRLIGLPLTSAPVVLFLALEQGTTLERLDVRTPPHHLASQRQAEPCLRLR